MNPILKRTAAGLAVGALVLALFLYCPLVALGPIILVLSTLVQLEFYQLAKAYRPVTWFGLLMGAFWLVTVAAVPADAFLSSLVNLAFPFFLIGSLFMLALVMLFSSRYEHPIASGGATLLGFFYVPYLMGFFLRFAQMDAPGIFGMPESRVGLYTLLALVVITKLSDTGGFALGVTCGRHKLCPTISPNKSWEGLVGSILFSAGAAALFHAIAVNREWASVFPIWGWLTYPRALVAGGILAVVATLGDLVESRFKRACGVKDSSTFLPAGMGGFLDMFDSLLFIPALVYPLTLMASY